MAWKQERLSCDCNALANRDSLLAATLTDAPVCVAIKLR